MTLTARVVRIPADPLRVARSLAREPGFSFLWSAAGGGPSYAACWPVAETDSLDPEASLALAPDDSSLASFPRWIGLLPYEGQRAMERTYRTPVESRPAPHVTKPTWLRYGAVARIPASADGDVLVAGDDPAQVRALSQRLEHTGIPGSIRWTPVASDDTDDAHAARITRALEAIVEGEIYQVNLARRFDFRFSGGAQDLLERLVQKTRSPFAFACSLASGLHVAASSPELFLDVSPGGRLLTMPIKGTRPRGSDAREDQAFADALENDPKERAELSMVVDVERNDLGKVARTASVRVLEAPRVEAYGSVLHRVASVTAWLRPDVSRGALLRAMLPSGSVTGAPKIRAMELIATLEAARRGLYTGALGYVSHDGGMRLGMAIRTVTAVDDVAHYFAGGGIVHGSDPAREVLETRWKAVQVLRLFDQ